MQAEEERQRVIERQLLDIVALTGKNEPRLLDSQTRRSEVQRVIKQVRLALPDLLYFAQELEAAQQEAMAHLGAAAVGLIAWAWQRREILRE